MDRGDSSLENGFTHQVGPHTFDITFQVMDINPAYNCLLQRPWIHAVGTVTYTPHQKLKFVLEKKMIIIFGEEDMLVSHFSYFQYIEAIDKSLETYI